VTAKGVNAEFATRLMANNRIFLDQGQ